jgi:hypothetical protein
MNHSTSRKQELIYHIDRSDRLCELDAAWTRFALANDGAAVMPERVLGRPLWDFIGDAHVRELYRQMVQRVRSGYPVSFDYRCDAPEWRRRFRMTIRTAPGATVEFLSQLRWEELRPRVDMLDVNRTRSEHWVRVCGWCQNVSLRDESWGPVEAAVEQLGLLADEALPRLTHGICLPCHTGMMAQLAPAAGTLGRAHPVPPPADLPSYSRTMIR